MPLQRFGQRVLNRYGSGITGLVGGNLNGVTFQWGNSGTSTAGNVVTVDRQDWLGMDRKDRRGMLIHELTHAAQRNMGLGGDTGAWASNKIEKVADAVRYSLNGAHGINPDTLAAAKRIAERRGWTGDTNMAGPGSNKTGTRSRNTLQNNASKKTNAQVPALSPGQVVGFNTQLQGLATQYAGARALAAQQKGSAAAQFALARQQAQAAAVQGVTSAENAALDRGLLGSSVDLNNRAGVLAQRDSDILAAKLARGEARGQAALGVQQAGADYMLGVGNIQAAEAAAQSDLANQQFLNDTILGLNQTKYADAIAAARARIRGRRRDLAGSPNTPGNLGNVNLPPSQYQPEGPYFTNGNNRGQGNAYLPY